MAAKHLGTQVWTRWLANAQTKHEKGDLCDFEAGMIVGARQVVLSVLGNA